MGDCGTELALELEQELSESDMIDYIFNDETWLRVWTTASKARDASFLILFYLFILKTRSTSYKNTRSNCSPRGECDTPYEQEEND
jgi:hypothetical protein